MKIISNIKFGMYIIIILTILEIKLQLHNFTHMSKNLQFKYDNYDDDFENDDQPTVKQFPIQTDIALKKSPEKSQQEQSYQQDFNQYKPNTPGKAPIKLTPDREKMIEQNIKLKTQIYQLAKQMDEIMAKDKAKKKYGIHADEEDNQVIRQKKEQLKKQQVEILQLKNKIYMTKKQLQHVYDSRGIQGKEDELKNLQIKLKALKDEKQGLMRIKKQQNRALNIVKDGEQYDQKVRNLKQTQHKLRQEIRMLSQKVTQNQRTLRKCHQQFVIKQNRVKQMQQKIKENREKSKKNNFNAQVTNQMVQEVQIQLSQLEKQRKQAQKVWTDKIRKAEQQLYQRKMQEQKKLLILKDKEKQLKLSQIRIKELKKLINHNKADLNPQKKSNNQEQDMKQYRHKRNIKYLQKK